MALVDDNVMWDASWCSQILNAFVPAGEQAFTTLKGNIEALPKKVKDFVHERARLCNPDNIYICDGSEDENIELMKSLEIRGLLTQLTKYDNCWLARTNPADVARNEGKTVISTASKSVTVAQVAEGVKGLLGQWMSPGETKKAFVDRFPACMKGRTMFVVAFSMGPVGSSFSKIGIQLTDSAYVVCCLRIMTRMGNEVIKVLGDGDFVRCMHSVGRPLPLSNPSQFAWPCNPEKLIIAHMPELREICSFGSGYGGNSILAKKCFALRIGSVIAHQEGWLAEHMMIMAITCPNGKKYHIAAAFPSACGKTNLAMIEPSIPNYKCECIGDDIAWLKFNKEGNLMGINPEHGFFGVAPGTSMSTNANAMRTITKNTLFTNVAETSDGGFFWEGLENEIDLDKVTITSWLGQKNWTKDSDHTAAHANARFCTPCEQCPVISRDWDDPAGVPIDAILFGSRRANGVPLVYESFDWKHGVFIGSSLRSEATAAAEHKGKVVMHDPFAMRPFFGYNFGDYLRHWLSMEDDASHKLPRIFCVNWFRKNEAGMFIWPGFGENIRVLDWICRRCDGEDIASVTPIGYVPKSGSLNTAGLNNIDTNALIDISIDFWLEETKHVEKFYEEQIGADIPSDMSIQLNNLQESLLATR